MDESFVPLFPANAGGAFATPSPIALANRPAAAMPSAPPPAPHACVRAATPLVTFKREGDRVTQIHVECPCGHVVVLDCEY